MHDIYEIVKMKDFRKTKVKIVQWMYTLKTYGEQMNFLPYLW